MNDLDRIFTHERRKPKLQRSTTRLNSPNSFRVWRGSPEDVAFQFRLETQYVTMNIPLALAREIADHIKFVAQ